MVGFRDARQLATMLLIAEVAVACAYSASQPTDAPPAESACSDLAALRRTLRELPVRDIESGLTDALSQAWQTRSTTPML